MVITAIVAIKGEVVVVVVFSDWEERYDRYDRGSE